MASTTGGRFQRVPQLRGERCFRAHSPSATFQAQVPVNGGSGDAATQGALQIALLDKIGFEYVLDGVLGFANRGSEVVHPHRTTTKLVDDGHNELLVHQVEADGIHVEQGQGGIGRGPGDAAIGFHLGVVAHPAQQPVGDSGRAPGAARDFQGPLRVQRSVQQLR